MTGQKSFQSDGAVRRLKNWYLVYSKPRQERIAKANLDRQGYETYLPLIRQPRRRKGKRLIAVEPMFPRYLFVRLDLQRDNSAPIRSTTGVVSLVRFGHEAAKAPEDLIVLIRSRDDEQGIQDLPVPDYRHGDAVRIMEGPLRGYQGVFLARSGRERVVVLLEIMGKHTRVKVDESWIDADK